MDSAANWHGRILHVLGILSLHHGRSPHPRLLARCPLDRRSHPRSRQRTPRRLRDGRGRSASSSSRDGCLVSNASSIRRLDYPHPRPKWYYVHAGLGGPSAALTLTESVTQTPHCDARIGSVWKVLVVNMPGRGRILFGFYMLTIFWLWAWRCDGARLVMEAARARVQEAFDRAPKAANLLAFWAPAAGFTRQRRRRIKFRVGTRLVELADHVAARPTCPL
jgi:hypothetical protein